MLDRAHFQRLMTVLCVSFRVEQDLALFEGYWLGLRDLEDSALSSAVERAIRESQHMPRAVELRRLSGEQTQDERAIAAWASVRAATRMCGAYASVDFADAAINASIRAMGGWPRLCLLEGTDFDVWAQKEFSRQYEAWSAMRVGRGHSQTRPLAGLTEIANAPNGRGWTLTRIAGVDYSIERIEQAPLRSIDAGPNSAVAAVANKMGVE